MSQEAENAKGEGDGINTVDMSDGRDRQLILRATRERWPIPMAKREKITENLIKIAAGEDPKQDQRAQSSAARTLARMDAINQADAHADRHYERIDNDQPTELVKHEGVEIVVPGLPRINAARGTNS